MNTALNTTLTNQVSVDSKLTAIVDQTVFFLKTAVILSTTVLLLASAWV